MHMHTTPALMVRADVSIGDCLRRMREHESSFCLIINDTDVGPTELVGVFTTGDLMKHIIYIKHGDHWSHPVRTVMSRPIVSLDVSEIHRAGELMLEHEIRHIPIVHSPEVGKREVLGLVSMRDLFRIQMQERRDLKWTGLTLKIGVLTDKNEPLEAHSGKIFSLMKVTLVKVPVIEGKFELKERVDGFFVDLDTLEPGAWQKILKQLNQANDLPRTLVIFDPYQHKPEVVTTLQKLKGATKFAIFEKPINLTEFLQELGQTPKLS
ncbi:MAG: CBS domain-containing protein [Bdellovibrionales bacterium]|nr:CBS domain-containing protein [Bdellovibrionales bacterium]